jgi:hypothetical protein
MKQPPGFRDSLALQLDMRRVLFAEKYLRNTVGGSELVAIYRDCRRVDDGISNCVCLIQYSNAQVPIESLGPDE